MSGDIIISEGFFMNKKLVLCIVLIISLFLIFLPEQKSLSVSENDLEILSNVEWNNKDTIDLLGFSKYDSGRFLLDYNNNTCTAKIKFLEETTDDIKINVTDYRFNNKFELWFTPNPPVVREIKIKYKNIELRAEEIENIHRKDRIKLAEYLEKKLQLAE